MKAPRMYSSIGINNTLLYYVNDPADARGGPNLPGTSLYLSPNTTMIDLFTAAGYVTFDTALPQPWVDQWNACRCGPYTVPKGVWCYDKDKGCGIFGMFVPMEDALRELAKVLPSEYARLHEGVEVE